MLIASPRQLLYTGLMKKTAIQFSITALLLTGFCNSALADIYKHIDAEGRVTYSNIKSKNASKLSIADDTDTADNAEQASNPSTKTRSSPKHFPRVDADTQNQRDTKRQAILEAELLAEKSALDLAKKAHAEAASKPEIAHQKNSDGSVSTYRNMAKFNEKMKPLQAEVDNHQNNIELLQKELNGMR